MKVDITEILSPDIKSRVSARDLLLFLQNSGESEVTVDFRNVKFATRSFIDEFYGIFMKNRNSLSFKVQATNVPENIQVIFDSVSRTQTKNKTIPSTSSVKSFRTVDEMLNYLNSVPF